MKQKSSITPKQYKDRHPSKPSNTIYHFTSVGNLYRILLSGLKLSDGRNWKDKNDRYGIEQYRKFLEKDGKNILVLCFCNNKGNVFLWKEKEESPSQLTQYDEYICRIGFNTKLLRKHLANIDGIREPRLIEYCSNNEVLNSQYTVEEIPYLKREEYAIEHEVRIVYVGFEEEIFITNIKDCITDITINTNKKEVLQHIQEKLHHEYNIDNRIIKSNGYSNSPTWQKNIRKFLNPSNNIHE